MRYSPEALSLKFHHKVPNQNFILLTCVLIFISYGHLAWNCARCFYIDYTDLDSGLLITLKKLTQMRYSHEALSLKFYHKVPNQNFILLTCVLIFISYSHLAWNCARCFYIDYTDLDSGLLVTLNKLTQMRYSHEALNLKFHHKVPNQNFILL